MHERERERERERDRTRADDEMVCPAHEFQFNILYNSQNKPNQGVLFNI
jgi:hypothetical protein